MFVCTEGRLKDPIPDMADDVNDHMLDGAAEAWNMAKNLHAFLESLGGWYPLAKAKNPKIARALTKVYYDIDEVIKEGK